MGTKNTAKIKSIFADLFSKKDSKDDKTILAETRVREQELMSKLEAMLTSLQYSTGIKLPEEKIKEYRIPNRIARMRQLLEIPLISNVDTTALYNHILGFADALDMALKKGYDRMAYWASMALHKTVETLWIETPALYIRDPEMEMALYANKLNYAHSFSNIIALAKKHDSLEEQRKTEEPDHVRRTEELQARRNAYLAMSRTEAGQKLVASAESKMSDPTSLTREEKAYIDNKERIERLTGLTKASLSVMEALDTQLITVVKDMETTRMQLLQEPDVDDPKLNIKVKEANRLFREQITRRLDEAYESMRAHDEHVEGMDALRGHAAIKYRYARIQEEVDRLETAELNRSLAELEARRDVVRKAQNAIMLEQQVRDVQKQIEDEVIEIREPEPEIEVEMDQEPEVEIEYDL